MHKSSAILKYPDITWTECEAESAYGWLSMMEDGEVYGETCIFEDPLSDAEKISVRRTMREDADAQASYLRNASS